MLISSQLGRGGHQIFHQVKTTHKSECQNLKKKKDKKKMTHFLRSFKTIKAIQQCYVRHILLLFQPVIGILHCTLVFFRFTARTFQIFFQIQNDCHWQLHPWYSLITYDCARRYMQDCVGRRASIIRTLSDDRMLFPALLFRITSSSQTNAL